MAGSAGAGRNCDGDDNYFVGASCDDGRAPPITTCVGGRITIDGNAMVEGKIEQGIGGMRSGAFRFVIGGDGLLFHTILNLEHAQLGFQTTNVTEFTAMPADAAGFGNLAVSAEEKQPSTSIAALTYEAALERVRAVPGVEEAAVMSAPPLSGVALGEISKSLGGQKIQGISRARYLQLSADDTSG